MIFYSVVARGTIVLVEHHDADGNFLSLTNSLLAKIPPSNAKKSFTFEKYNYHYIVDDGIVFLCLAAYDLGFRIPFHFLEDVQVRFKRFTKGVPIPNLTKDAVEPFKFDLQERMIFYSDPHRSDSMVDLKTEADKVVDILQKNMGENEPLTGFNSLRRLSQIQKRISTRKNNRKILLGMICIVLLLGSLIALVVLFVKHLWVFK